MKKGKFLILFVLLSFFLPALPALAKEEPEVIDEVSVTLHKRVWEGQQPDAKPNTGHEMDDFGGTPLDGAGFTAYNVTQIYFDLLAADKKVEEAISQIQKQATLGTLNALVEKTEQFTESPAEAPNSVGATTFHNLPMETEIQLGGKNVFRDSVFAFVETTTPENVKARALPIVLKVPIANSATDPTSNTTIHLYPKNTKDENRKELTNNDNFPSITIDGKEYPNVKVGDVLDYQVSYYAPHDLDPTTYTSFKISDKPDLGLSINPNSVVIQGLAEGEDYTVIYSPNENVPAGGFVIDFILTSEKVQDLANKKIQITYKMTVTEDIPAGEFVNNTAEIELNKNGDVKKDILPGPDVMTGGFKFRKIDGSNQKGLAAAEFYVFNDKGQYGIFTQKDSEWVLIGWSDEKSDAIAVISGKDGYFTLRGLLDGDYQMKEKEAPEGFILSNKTIKFKVEAEKFKSLEIRDITNAPKGLLPNTGGKGIFLYLMVGLILSSLTMTGYKKLKVSREV